MVLGIRLVRRALFTTLAVVALWSGVLPNAGMPAPNPGTTPQHIPSSANSTQQQAEAETQLQQRSYAALDKRIDDANSRVSDIIISITLLALLITIITAVANIVAYFSAAQRARDAARQWMDEHADTLRTSLSKIEARATEAERLAGEADARARQADTINVRAQAAFEAARSKSETFLQELEGAKNRAQALLRAPTDGPNPIEATPTANAPPLSAAQRGALIEAEQLLREKPEASYQFSDWEERAWAAYTSGDLESSAVFHRNAALAADARPEQVAEASLNRALTLGELGRSDEEATEYDEIIDRFADSPVAKARAQAYHAMHNRRIELNRQGRHTEALELCDKILTKYEKYTDDQADLVASTLLSKGIALAGIGKPQDAVQCHERLITEFEKAAKISIQDTVFNGMVCMASDLSALGQDQQALKFADRAMALGEKLRPGNIKRVVTAKATKGTILCKMGELRQALEILDEVIRKYHGSNDREIIDLFVHIKFIRAIANGRLGNVSEARADLRKLVLAHSESSNKTAKKLLADAASYADAPVTEWEIKDYVW